MAQGLAARHVARLRVVGLCLALLPSHALAQLPSGAQRLTYVSPLDQTQQSYLLVAPPVLETGRAYPLVIALHDAGLDAAATVRQVLGRGRFSGSPAIGANQALPVEMLLAVPAVRGEIGYQGIGEKELDAMLADIQRRMPVDPGRVSLLGIGAGAGGALWLAATQPQRWSAVVTVSPILAPGTEELLGNLVALPVRIVQGDRDVLVPTTSVRRLHKRLLDESVAVEYIEYPGPRSTVFEYALRDGALLPWAARHQRLPVPERVRFRTRQLRYGENSWVRLDAIEPGTAAQVDAHLSERNSLRVTTEGVAALTFSLSNHPAYAKALPVRLEIDGTPLRSKEPTIPLVRSARGWRVRPSSQKLTGKQRGQEGPISEVIASRHVYVYGTADSPDPQEQQQRQQMAQRAAEWRASRERPPVAQWLVVSDEQAEGMDLSGSNLVVLGAPETNRLLAARAARLPMSLQPSAADFGLLYVYPLENGRQMLVCSGLPWWSGSSRPPFQLLSTLPDYVLFRGSLANVAAQGFFSREWRLPAEAAELLRQSGAVRVPSSQVDPP